MFKWLGCNGLRCEVVGQVVTGLGCACWVVFVVGLLIGGEMGLFVVYRLI